MCRSRSSTNCMFTSHLPWPRDIWDSGVLAQLQDGLDLRTWLLPNFPTSFQREITPATMGVRGTLIPCWVSTSFKFVYFLFNIYSYFIHIKYFYKHKLICVYMCLLLCVWTHVPLCVCRTEANFQELFAPFTRSPETKLRSSGFIAKTFYPLSHLAGPPHFSSQVSWNSCPLGMTGLLPSWNQRTLTKPVRCFLP